LPLNDQITVSFVRAAGVLAKGRMFDMPALYEITIVVSFLIGMSTRLMGDDNDDGDDDDNDESGMC
jgi:hypothetical protein